MKHTKRTIALLLCFCTLFSLLPINAVFAAEKVTIDSTDKTDYFEYLSGAGSWEDLNTPQHTVKESGAVAYCIQHKKGNPHDAPYTEFDPTDKYSTRTILGLQIILENGYPCSNGGFSAAEARYATANAVRFWLSEEGADNQYNFTNRKERPNAVRAKSGYQDLLDWADSLVELARKQKVLPHSVSFSPSTIDMTASGNYFVGSTTVSLVNCNGGYTVDVSDLPEGSKVTGYTGKDGDNLTFRIPISNGDLSLRLTATGKDNRTAANLFWYGADSSSLQDVIAYATGSYAPTAQGKLNLSTPAGGRIQITKTDETTGAKLSGAVFGIYADQECDDLVDKVTVADNGVGTSGELTAATYYVKEITAPAGYVLDEKVYAAEVAASVTYKMTVANVSQGGKIRITKTNANTTLGTPSLAGAVFDILSGGKVVDTVTTDASGKATSKVLPLGTYTVRERTAPKGFVAAPDKTVKLEAGEQSETVVYGDVTVPNTPQVGRIVITKLDGEAGSEGPLKDAVFEICDKSGKLMDTVTTGGDGKATSKELPLGTYTLKEIEAPEGYTLLDHTREVTIEYGDQTQEVVVVNINIINNVQTGKIRVTKANADKTLGMYSLAGTVFAIRDEGGALLQNLTTDESGTAESEELPLGTYTVQEVSAPYGFVLNTTPKKVTLSGGDTEEIVYADVTIANTPQVGRITVRKQNSNSVMGEYSLVGAVFEVKRDGALVDTITTDRSGEATTKDLPLGTYTIREKTAPTGFVLSDDVETVTLTYAGQTVSTVYGEATIGNKPQVGTITVVKHDSETGTTPQGDATLNGARYVVMDSDRKVVDTLQALGSASVTSKELKLGTYTVTEVIPPTGYLLNSQSHTVTLEYAGQHIEVTRGETSIKDDVIKGRIHLTKFGSSELGTSQTDPDAKPALEGVVFEIRLKSTGELYDTLTTNADGRATSKLLPYGTYIVTETVGKEGYLKVLPFEVFVSEDEKTYDYILEDDTVEMKIRLAKKDAATNRTIPIAGTTFRIEDSDGKPVTFDILYPQPHVLREFVTDASGTLYLPSTLAYGTYTLYELEAPEGYLLSDDGVEFSVSEQNAVNGVISVTFKDEAVKGKIMVEKKGEQLSGYTTEMTDYGELYIPEYVNRGLQGVTFGVYAAENIGTPDGTVYHEMGDLVCEIKTGSDGVAITEELYLGKYNVVEHVVPSGFVLDTTPHEVILAYKDQVTPLVMETMTIENTRQKAEVQITKLAEYFDYDCGAFYTDYGKGFVFGLYTKRAIGEIPANALMDVLVTGENGKVQSTADLPVGEYYLTELDIPYDGYIMLTGSTPVDLSSKNDSDEKFTESEFFENKMYKKRIAVEKYDCENSLRKLPGAVFEVLTEDGKQVITTFATNAEGYGESSELPLGNYILRERQAPYGFVLSDKTVDVKLAKGSDPVVVFSMENVEVKGQITVEKTGEQLVGFDAEDTFFGKKYVPKYEIRGLEGVVFEVFAAEDIVSFDGIEHFRKGDKVAELTTESDGKATIGKLPLGRYEVVEKSVPAGFVLDDTPHEVFLRYKDQHTAIVTETASIENTRQKAKLELAKTAEYFNYDTAEFYDSFGKGFVFGLYTTEAIGQIPADALMEILLTGESGTAQSTVDLPLGKYYLKELQAPTKGYILNTENLQVDLTSKNNTDLMFTGSASADNDMFKKRIAVQKVDIRDSERGLAGAVFEVLNEADRKVITTIITDENGYGESCELPLGKYVLCEQTAPIGFVITDETYPVELTYESETVVSIVIENEPTMVTLEKEDITTADALPGATIEVYNEAGEVAFTGDTNMEGSVIIHELPVGTYTWRETIAPIGYAINVAEFTFAIDAYGSVTGDTVMTDEPITVKVKKINSFTEEPMPGVAFTLSDSEGNAVKLAQSEEGWYLPGGNADAFAVGDDGTAEIRYLPAGDYTLMEITPTGFVSHGEIAMNVTQEYGPENPYSVVVYNTPTALRLLKTHAQTGKPLTGAGFAFKTTGFLASATFRFDKLEEGVYMIAEEGEHDTLMVDENGELTVIGLPLGEVWIEETVVPSGFFPIAAVKVTLADEHTLETPLMQAIENEVFVKLGMDYDKYEWLYPYIAIAVLLGGGAAGFIVYRKRKVSK